MQNIIVMENDTSALKLTTASYWRPSGKNIHRFPDSKETDEWGVKPNGALKCRMKDEERLEYMIYRRERDALTGKNGGPPPKPKSNKGKEKKPSRIRCAARSRRTTCAVS